MTRATRDAARRLVELLDDATALGYRVEFVEWVECSDSPGILGFRAGVCIPRTRTIRILARLSRADKVEVLAHELEHAREPTLEAALRIDADKKTLDYERAATAAGEENK